MLIFASLVGLVVLALCGFIAWKVGSGGLGGNHSEETERLAGEKLELERLTTQLKVNLEQKSEEVGHLKAQLETEKADNQERQGKAKQLFAQFTEARAELEHLKKDREQLQKTLAKFEESGERREREFEDRLAKLEAAKVSLDLERQRVLREDEEAQRTAEEERDRVWAEHEIGVISRLTELCKQPQYAFSCFTNTSLPEGFDGSLKPDFMIEFLGQYVIFDAKKSKSESLQTYITNTVKSTVTKVKKNEKIASVIYLVVPTEAIGELKTHYHVQDGYTLYIVSPEALAPILASLKRITAYEFAEQMDPQQRENIVQMVAELDFHINLRNATDLVLTKMGTELLERAQRADPSLAEEVAQKKLPMNAKAAVAAADIKKIVAKITAQNEELQALVSPRAAVRKKDVEQAEALLTETLF